MVAQGVYVVNHYADKPSNAYQEVKAKFFELLKRSDLIYTRTLGRFIILLTDYHSPAGGSVSDEVNKGNEEPADEGIDNYGKKSGELDDKPALNNRRRKGSTERLEERFARSIEPTYKCCRWVSHQELENKAQD